MAPPTISDMASEPMTSIRSKAATTAPSAPRATARRWPGGRRRGGARRPDRPCPEPARARWLPVGAGSCRSFAASSRSRGSHSGTSSPASLIRSASSRPIGTSTWTRSTPAATSAVASPSAAWTLGSWRVTPNHGRAPRRACRSSRCGPSAGHRTVRSQRVASRVASASATVRRSCSRRSSLSSDRSIVPAATSRASCCGSRSYSRGPSRRAARSPPRGCAGRMPASDRRSRRRAVARRQRARSPRTGAGPPVPARSSSTPERERPMPGQGSARRRRGRAAPSLRSSAQYGLGRITNRAARQAVRGEEPR